MGTPKRSGFYQAAEKAVSGIGPEDDLIRGWKGIAEYLHISVKTAQRYEKDYRLPIRHKRGLKGTAIYALRSELSAWLASGAGQTDPGQIAPPGQASAAARPLRWLWMAIAAVCVSALVLVVPRFLVHREPATWRIDQRLLSVSDARGTVLWSHAFDFSLLQPPTVERSGIPVGQFVDLDGDGRKEFLFLAIASDPYKSSFYCFDADGSVRFSVVPGRTITRTVRFGENVFSPPFGVTHFKIADEPGGKKSVMVFSDDPTWFPSVIQKYSSSGKLQGEFWNPGRIVEARGIDIGTRRYLLVGGTNNEFHAGSLSILDRDRPWGFAPATKPHYQCRDCPPGAPLHYFVFPELEIAKVLNAWPMAWSVHLDSPDRISVHVLQTREPFTAGGPAGLTAAAVYRFDSHFKLLDAELDEGYRATHSALELLGGLKHNVGPQDEKELLPALRWTGTSFQPIWP